MEEMQFQRQGSVATLTINRPAYHNAMTWAMYDRLVALCDRVDADEDILVWIIRATGGKAFVAGTDIRQFVSFQETPNAGVVYEERIDSVLGRLAAVTKPVIAWIDGYAFGGGMMMSLFCDLRVATLESTFSIPCVKLGNCLSMKNYARLLQLVGPAKTLELVYTGRPISAQQAAAMGLVNAVLPQDEISAYVQDLVSSLTRAAPLTLRVTKEAVRRLTTLVEVEGTDLIRLCYESADFQEGVSAFLEKREAIWRGR